MVSSDLTAFANAKVTGPFASCEILSIVFSEGINMKPKRPKPEAALTRPFSVRNLAALDAISVSWRVKHAVAVPPSSVTNVFYKIFAVRCGFDTLLEAVTTRIQ
jgi:hypothetical protein